METVNTGNHNQDSSELKVHMTRINELVANMIKQEIYLKGELATKKEDLASFTASLENSNKEIAELETQIEKLQRQIPQMRKTNEINQSLIGELRGLVTEQEVQLKNLKEGIGSKEQVITSFAVSLENSKKEIAELHKQVEELKATNENKESLIGEYKEKVDALSRSIPVLTNRQSEPQAKEENTSFAVSLENSKKEITELHKPVEELKATNENKESLIGEDKEKVDALSESVPVLTNRQSEPQAKEENTSFAVSLENSKKEIAELHKPVEELKATNEDKESLIREYKKKIDSLSESVSVLTNRQSEPKAKEDNKVQKAERKSQKKLLKRLLKEYPKANEKELTELLGVDSSYIIKLRKELDN